MARKKKTGSFSSLSVSFGKTKKRGKKSAFDKLATSSAGKGRGRNRISRFGDNIVMGFAGRGKKRRGRDSKIVRDAARAWANRMSPTERYDEREEMMDELERNPQRFADEVRANRLARLMPWINRVANFFIRRVKKDE